MHIYGIDHKAFVIRICFFVLCFMFYRHCINNYIFLLFAKTSFTDKKVYIVILHGNVTYVWGQLYLSEV